MAADHRDTFARALDHIQRTGAPPATAFQLEGLDPDSLSADEWRRVAEAEQVVVDEAIGQIKAAAQTDASAARWLRERGIDGP